MESFNQRPARTRLLLLAAVAWAFLLPAAAAQATPVNMYFSGTGFGFDSTSVSAFMSAGGQTLSPTPNLFDNSTTNHIGLSTPGPLTITLSSNNFTKASPFVWTTTWSATALDQDYSNLWVVFATHDPTDAYGYSTANVGIQADPQSSTRTWRLIQPSQGTTYLAIFVGDLKVGGPPVQFTFNYVVGQDLFSVANSNPTQFVLPKLLVGFTQAVPEPGSLVLMVVGLAGALAAARRRSC